MKHGAKLLACMLGGIALSAAGAVTETDNTINPVESENPYQQIIDRNVFSLKPPPPPPDPEANKPPPAKITLTGITTILGKKALMKTPAPAVKPGTPPGTPPPTEQFYMLGEGEREGEIEVVAIDEKAGSVKVLNSGNEVTLTFEKDGTKVPTTPMAATPMGVPGMLPAPGGVVAPPAVPATFNPGGTQPQFPVRPMRAPGQTGVQPSGAGTGVPLPSFTSATPMQSAIPDNNMSHEEQIITMEAQRALTQKQVMSGRLPPLPPTIMTPAGSPGSLQGANNPADQGSSGNHIINLPPLPGRNLPPPPPFPQ